MKKVFAVLIFLPLFIGCSHLKSIYQSKTNLFSGNNVIYSAHGDFDGDKRIEYLTIIKDDNKLPVLRIKDRSKTYSQELSINIHSLNPQVSDINDDKLDDIIVCSNFNGAVDMFAYTFSNEIKTVFSPQTLKQKISFSETKKGYYLSSDSIKKFIISSEKLSLNFYLSELDSTNGRPVINSQGTITSSKNKIISLVSVQFTINRQGMAEVQDIQVKPYDEINIE